MSPSTVRHKILAYLAQHPNASASQVGLALGLAPASVRHHLGILKADGRVSLRGERRARSRGRPTKVFGLSERIRGDNLAGLATTLLDAVVTPSGLIDDRILATLVQGLLDQVGWMDEGGSAQGRLSRLVDRLNVLHYEASWEAGAAGPRVLLGHCPYAAIIDKHPELCLMDARMLGAQLGTTARQTAKIDDRLQGQAHCIFTFM